jgi:hypothetical protein
LAFLTHFSFLKKRGELFVPIWREISKRGDFSISDASISLNLSLNLFPVNLIMLTEYYPRGVRQLSRCSDWILLKPPAGAIVTRGIGDGSSHGGSPEPMQATVVDLNDVACHYSYPFFCMHLYDGV